MLLLLSCDLPCFSSTGNLTVTVAVAVTSAMPREFRMFEVFWGRPLTSGFVFRVKDGRVFPYICFAVTSGLGFRDSICSKVSRLGFRVLESNCSIVSSWTSSACIVPPERLFRVSLVKFDTELHVLRSNGVNSNHDLVHGVDVKSCTGTTYIQKIELV